MHISCLELLVFFTKHFTANVATLAVKCFVKDKRNIRIHLRMDNTTALNYINKLGGTVSPELNRLTKDLQKWCLEREITLQSTHLARALNVTADEESRVMKDKTDWILCPQTFRRINHLIGPLQVDLFASRLTHQLYRYVSWRPDPYAMTTDAFTLNWVEFKGYANPPWNFNNQSTHPNQDSTGKTGPSGSSMESTTLVPNPAGNANTQTDPTTQQAGPDTTNSQSQLSRHDTTFSRMENLRDRFRNQEISEEASTLLLTSWRHKTAKAYDLLFGMWVSWYSERDTDPISGNTAEVVNFLSTSIPGRIPT